MTSLLVRHETVSERTMFGGLIGVLGIGIVLPSEAPAATTMPAGLSGSRRLWG